MRRFAPRTLALVILPMLALACSSDQQGSRRCVDRNGNLVAEWRCQGVADDDGGRMSPFFWYYMGQLNGSHMSGGYYAPRTGYYYVAPGGRNYARPSSGLFGSGAHESGGSVRGISGLVGGSHVSVGE